MRIVSKWLQKRDLGDGLTAPAEERLGGISPVLYLGRPLSGGPMVKES